MEAFSQINFFIMLIFMTYRFFPIYDFIRNSLKKFVIVKTIDCLVPLFFYVSLNPIKTFSEFFLVILYAGPEILHLIILTSLFHSRLGSVLEIEIERKFLTGLIIFEQIFLFFHIIYPMLPQRAWITILAFSHSILNLIMVGLYEIKIRKIQNSFLTFLFHSFSGMLNWSRISSCSSLDSN